MVQVNPVQYLQLTPVSVVQKPEMALVKWLHGPILRPSNRKRYIITSRLWEADLRRPFNCHATFLHQSDKTCA